MKDLSIWNACLKSEMRRIGGVKAAYYWYKFRMAVRSRKPKGSGWNNNQNINSVESSEEYQFWWDKLISITALNDERSVATEY